MFFSETGHIQHGHRVLPTGYRVSSCSPDIEPMYFGCARSVGSSSFIRGASRRVDNILPLRLRH